MHFRLAVFIPFFLLLCLLAAGFENGGMGDRFEPLGPFGGDVRSLLVDAQDSDTVYLGTSSGLIFKSLDSGKSWAPLHPGIGRNSFVIDSLVQHPGEQNHIYAGAWDLFSEGGGLFETRDAGLHWTQIHVAGRSVAVRGLSICNSQPAFMIVGTLAGPYVSSDGGRSWKRVGGNDLQKSESVAIDPSDHNILYVGTWRLGYRSTDFGKTWNRVDNGMPLDSDVFSIAIDPRKPSLVYSGACSGVYRSENRAHLWTRLKLLPGRFTIRAQVVYLDPANPARVYSGTTEGLFVSNNNGHNWTRLTSESVTVNAIQVNPENSQNILIGTEYQGVLLSSDGGRTWKESNSGFIHRQISWMMPDPGKPGNFLAGMASGSGGLYSYDVHTEAWTSSQIMPGMRILSFLILPKNSGRLAGTSQGLFWQPRTSDPWTKLKGSIARRTVRCLAMDPHNPVIYAGTDQGIYRTSLSAMDFRVPPGYRANPQVWCITAPSTSPGVVYAGSSLGLLRSWDRAVTWSPISAYGLPSRTVIECIAVSPANKDQIFAGTSVGLFESANGGIHWRPAGNGNLRVNSPSVIFLDDSGKTILAADGNSGGVFYSKDAGQTWGHIALDYASAATCLLRDPARPSQVYVGTQTDGVYRLVIP
jgi:photosystem II stability/assembly factor-like uncharacterized protein